MISRSLVELGWFNPMLLWAIAILAIGCVIVVVLTSRTLQSVPQRRAPVVGIAVTLFVAPVYAVTFDPWWFPPWPSIYITAALATGEIEALASFFVCCFFLPPVAWGFLAGVAWHCVDGGPPKWMSNSSETIVSSDDPRWMTF